MWAIQASFSSQSSMPKALFDVPAVPTHPLWRGSDARFFERALELREQNPWLKSAYPEPDSEEFYFWSVNFGLRMSPELVAPLLPAMPPAEQLKAVSGSDSQENFLNAGANSAEEILRIQREAGLDPFVSGRVLDFGCGCARVLRHLLPLSCRSELWGCDIDEKAIAHCRSTIGSARFVANQAAPALPFSAGYFDLIFSISIFTHLARALHDLWVHELRRLLSSAGHAVISLHGEKAWSRLGQDAELRRQMMVREADLEAVESNWRRDGFAFVPHVVPDAYRHEEPYGLVFVRPDAVPSFWPGFELVRYDVGVLSDWQDLALFRAI